MSTPANPFEVLRLDPSASAEEVVRQAARLRQRCPDEASLGALRQAVQEVTGAEAQRALCALLTHPRPGYQCPALDRLAAAFRRPPAAEHSACPPLDRAEFAGLLRAVVAEELSLPAVPFEDTGGDDPPDEVSRQSAEAIWQSLLFDPRG